LYCTVQNLRDEGVPSTGYGAVTDQRLTILIQRSGASIDLYTGRWFEARTQTFLIDGKGSVSLFLEQPIISITEILLDGVAMSSDDYVVYNRHLTENLLNPDDRENPRIEVKQPLEDEYLFRMGLTWFPKGQQNISVSGKFGYTDYDSGTTDGVTPPLITEACKMMVLRNLPLKYGADPTSDEKAWWRMVQQRTRDQSITLANPAQLGHQGVGIYTGDPEIDNILRRYTRPPRLRVA
jgi:hypothetical protein